MPNVITIIEALPFNDLLAAINDPTNLSKEATVLTDIISIAMPDLEGVLVVALVNLFVTRVYASGGGTIAPSGNPEVDAQLSHGGGDLK